jgi:structural maintenance of chromosome 1
LGSATFIPIDTIKVNPVNERFRNLATGARLAIDLIKHDPIYERAVHYACGNTIICDSTQIARHVVYDKGNEVKGK